MPSGRVIRSLDQFLSDFWSRVSKLETGCWEWQGHHLRGYGQVRGMPHFMSMKVHRISWMISHGEIPPGMQVLHRCDNRPCCNPDHLFLGTNTDNVSDRVKKNRNGRIHTQKLSPREVLEIRSAILAGEKRLDIAKRFGVCRRHVTAIALRKVWAAL